MSSKLIWLNKSALQYGNEYDKRLKSVFGLYNA